MEGAAICLPQTEVLEMKLGISVRWFHLDVNGEGIDRATSVFVWCPALVVYRFSWTSVYFFHPPHHHWIFTQDIFSFKLQFSFHLAALVSIFSSLGGCRGHCAAVTLSGTPWAAFGELLLPDLYQSTEHPGVWALFRKCAGFVSPECSTSRPGSPGNVLPERPSAIVTGFWIYFHFCRGISCFSWLEKCLGTWISNTTALEDSDCACDYCRMG